MFFTPLDHHREPDMECIKKTSILIDENLRKGKLVILESTTYPGTTEELLIPMLKSKFGLKSGEDFYLAYSSEREDPGNANFNASQIPKVIGADVESPFLNYGSTKRIRCKHFLL